MLPAILSKNRQTDFGEIAKFSILAISEVHFGDIANTFWIWRLSPNRRSPKFLAISESMRAGGEEGRREEARRRGKRKVELCRGVEEGGREDSRTGGGREV